MKVKNANEIRNKKGFVQNTLLLDFYLILYLLLKVLIKIFFLVNNLFIIAYKLLKKI